MKETSNSGAHERKKNKKQNILQMMIQTIFELK